MGCDDENNNLARRLSPLPSPGTHVTTPPQDGRKLAGRTSSRGVHPLVDSHQSSSAVRPLGHSSTRIEPAPVVSPSQLPRIHYSPPVKASGWWPAAVTTSYGSGSFGVPGEAPPRVYPRHCENRSVHTTRPLSRRTQHLGRARGNRTSPSHPAWSTVLTSGRRASSRACCASRSHSSGATCSTTST